MRPPKRNFLIEAMALIRLVEVKLNHKKCVNNLCSKCDLIEALELLQELE